MNSEQLAKAVSKQQAIYDVYCRATADEHFTTEIQKAGQNYFVDRSIYYPSFAIKGQEQRGAVDMKLWDYNLSPMYFVKLLLLKKQQNLLSSVELSRTQKRCFNVQVNKT